LLYEDAHLEVRMTTVREIMNRELFSVRPSDTVESARNGILALGITAAPVLDDALRPVGIVSLRDLADEPKTDLVTARMSTPVVAAVVDDAVEAVAQELAAAKLRHLVVVDEAGRAVGMVSAGDLLRSLLGLPPSHPATFPSIDIALEAPLGWSEDFPLDVDWTLARAPAGPGVFALTAGEGEHRSIIWAEASENVRARLIDMLSMPRELDPALRTWIDHELFHLRFRVAPIADAERRARTVQNLRREIRHF
jgi:CBS domain-containing protein